jgi:nitrogen fixation NifU-like protein
LTSFQLSSYNSIVNNYFLEKLEYSKQLVKKALSEQKDPIVACSFGKDSMAVLHLVRQFKPDVKVLWNNTLVEYPDTYEFAHRIIKEWDLQVFEAKPQKTFWQIVSEFGWPIYPRNATGKRQKATVKCCKALKKLPTLKLLRHYKWDLYFTGLTRYESRLREFSAQRYGDYFYSKEWQIWKCHPIQDWTADDIWEYHRQFHLPHNPLYDKNAIEIRGGIRTGCWPCPQAIRYGKLEHLHYYYPRLFDLLVNKHGLGKEIGEITALKSIRTMDNNICAEEHQLNWGKIRNADGVGKVRGSCGDTMEVYIKVEDNKITKSRFVTDGCHSAIACGNAVTELTKEKNIPEALKITPDDILASVGQIQESESHCSILAVDALREAIKDYSSLEIPSTLALVQSSY